MSIRSLEIPTGLLPHEGTATSNVNADPVIPAYSNTNGMPFVGDKNLHMEVCLMIIFSFDY